MTAENRIRPATPADVHTLVRFRAEMFRDMGWTDEGRLAELAPRYEAYVLESLASGDFLGWLAEDESGHAIACVGLLWERVPPTVRNLSGRQAYVLGLYVVPGWRRRGIARTLAETAVDYATANGADVVSLHASDEGRALYEQLGFVVSPEMRLFTGPASASWAPMAHHAFDDAD